MQNPGVEQQVQRTERIRQFGRVGNSEAIVLRVRTLQVEYTPLKMHWQRVYVENLERTMKDRKQPTQTPMLTSLQVTYFKTPALLKMCRMMPRVYRCCRKTIVSDKVGLCQEKIGFSCLCLELAANGLQHKHSYLKCLCRNKEKNR